MPSLTYGVHSQDLSVQASASELNIMVTSPERKMDSSSKTLINSLMNPDVYPHPCASVELIETHISWVLLTGLRAYKIKKPVDLGFVDFTTLKKRHDFCHDELRLNQRLAPHLYLDVVTITGSVESPEINGTGPVIDYAVCMLQFSQDQLLDRLPDSELTKARISRLADQCATFHQQADVAGPESPFGTPDAVWKPVQDNFDVLQQDEQCLSADISALKDRAGTQFRHLKEVFTERKHQTMIRECHGDLHLSNMFLHQDEFVVFDGIDFSESLRWIDVMNDIAFLIMDLENHESHHSAGRFLNRWLERTGDYAGLAVLPFYCAYRAAVRAKINVIRQHQPGLSASEQQHAAENCQRYLKQALQYTTTHPPVLNITMGVSGSGKTTVTQQMIENYRLIRVRSDVERKRLHGLEMEQSSGSDQKAKIYSAQATAATYERLAELTEIIIKSGFSVVVDATFLRRAERAGFSRLADQLGVTFRIITCDADEQTLRERIHKRRTEQTDASEADTAVLESQLQHQEPLSAEEQHKAVSATSDDFLRTLKGVS